MTTWRDKTLSDVLESLASLWARSLKIVDRKRNQAVSLDPQRPPLPRVSPPMTVRSCPDCGQVDPPCPGPIPAFCNWFPPGRGCFVTRNGSRDCQWPSGACVMDRPTHERRHYHCGLQAHLDTPIPVLAPLPPEDKAQIRNALRGIVEWIDKI